jgi:hypothetical protein
MGSKQASIELYIPPGIPPKMRLSLRILPATDNFANKAGVPVLTRGL